MGELIVIFFIVLVLILGYRDMSKKIDEQDKEIKFLRYNQKLADFDLCVNEFVSKIKTSFTAEEVIYLRSEPIFGFTMESRINATIASMIFIHPEGTDFSFFIYRRTGIIIETDTRTATIHSMSTCFVTEKLIPKIWGKRINGSSNELLDTW